MCVDMCMCALEECGMGEEGVYIPAFCTRMVHVGKLTGHNAGVSSLAVLNNLLITGSRDRLIKVWLWAWGTCVL